MPGELVTQTAAPSTDGSAFLANVKSDRRRDPSWRLEHMNHAIYQAGVWCEDCAASIKVAITRSRRAPADPDDQTSYDSEEYPIACGNAAASESDTPQHCEAGATCFNKITLDNGSHIGTWLENPLTKDGVAYVADAVANAGDVAKLWNDYYDMES